MVSDDLEQLNDEQLAHHCETLRGRVVEMEAELAGEGIQIQPLIMLHQRLNYAIEMMFGSDGERDRSMFEIGWFRMNLEGGKLARAQIAEQRKQQEAEAARAKIVEGVGLNPAAVQAAMERVNGQRRG